AKRLGSVFRTIILGSFSPPGADLWRRYYEGARFENRIVLDPFMGGGTTIHEALRLGCKVVGVDYNPVAWWTVRSSVTLPDLARLEAGFRELRDKVAASLLSRYTTRCPRCGEGAYSSFVLWVRTAKCERCSSRVRLHESLVLRTEGDRKTVVCPQCGGVFETKARDTARCSDCGSRILLKGGVAENGHYACPECSHVQRVPRGATTPDAPEQYEMHAVRYVCPAHGEGFKRAQQVDLDAYTQAREHFRAGERLLPMPDQAIPDGWKTGDLLAHDYARWRDLFNPRQLLCAGTLLQAILELQDSDAREAFVTLWSASLEFNNMLCTYKGGNARRPGAVRHIFSHHAFVFPYEALENNFWGVGSQSGTFAHLYSARMRRAKEYSLLPREREVKAGRIVRTISLPEERIQANLAAEFAELAAGKKNALLLCANSERLPIPDRSVDAVVTDPPYSDNVQYGELSDFFYVWQRQALKGAYSEFGPVLVPKDREIVKNPKQGKDGSFYEEGLRRVFSECNRVLKDDGLLVFTFHHKAFEAWVNVLTAVLDAGFYISATYPVHSEMPLSVHIHNLESMSYDAILVCRKRGKPTRNSWKAIRELTKQSARRALETLGPSGEHLTSLDAYVLVLGKCLQCYSTHYPEIYEDSDGNKKVAIEQALREAQEIVAQLCDSRGAS
ncbi:MAG TPA: DNA methyltransferase, partial [Candidatus Methylomirabilis sp.]|nr:DNA methyltransferase [Candidatus Methylomirabilis sp.]